MSDRDGGRGRKAPATVLEADLGAVMDAALAEGITSVRIRYGWPVDGAGMIVRSVIWMREGVEVRAPYRDVRWRHAAPGDAPVAEASRAVLQSAVVLLVRMLEAEARNGGDGRPGDDGEVRIDPSGRKAQVTHRRAADGAEAETTWSDVGSEGDAGRADDGRRDDGHGPAVRRVRHKRRGTVYEVIGSAELQTSADVVEGSPLTIYRDEAGKWWARREDEFEDGRFEDAADGT